MTINIIKKNISAINNLHGALINNVISYLVRNGVPRTDIDSYSDNVLMIETRVDRDYPNVLVLEKLIKANLELLSIDIQDKVTFIKINIGE